MERTNGRQELVEPLMNTSLKRPLEVTTHSTIAIPHRRLAQAVI